MALERRFKPKRRLGGFGTAFGSLGGRPGGLGTAFGGLGTAFGWRWNGVWELKRGLGTRMPLRWPRNGDLEKNTKQFVYHASGWVWGGTRFFA